MISRGREEGGGGKKRSRIIIGQCEWKNRSFQMSAAEMSGGARLMSEA